MCPLKYAKTWFPKYDSFEKDCKRWCLFPKGVPRPSKGRSVVVRPRGEFAGRGRNEECQERWEQIVDGGRDVKVAGGGWEEDAEQRNEWMAGRWRELRNWMKFKESKFQRASKYKEAPATLPHRA
jgi:hypothetical protein